MKRYNLHFYYNDEEFENILHYQEGDWLRLARQKLYEIELTKPEPFHYVFIVPPPQNWISAMGWAGIKENFETILKKAVDTILYHHLNKDRIKHYCELEKEYLKRQKELYEEFARPYEEKIARLKAQISNLRKKFKKEEISQREWQFAKKNLDDEIYEIKWKLNEKKRELLSSPYFNCSRLKKEYQVPYDVEKVKFVN